MITIAIIAVVIYLAFHLGHAHANYRHGRAHGNRGVNLFWSSARRAVRHHPRSVRDTDRSQALNKSGSNTAPRTPNPRTLRHTCHAFGE